MTAYDYENKPFCAHQNSATILEGLEKPPAWPVSMKDDDGYYIVRWRVDKYLPQFTQDVYRAIIKSAFGMWENVCGIRFVEDDASGRGGIRFGLYPDARPGGVLADCMLPWDRGERSSSRMKGDEWLDLRVDYAEAWSNSQNPGVNQIDPVRTIGHEGGHGIGIEHIEEGNLMAPMYSRKIAVPQIGDIRQATIRYPVPTPRPRVNPLPVDPSSTDIQQLFARFAAANRCVISENGKDTTLWGA